MHIAAFCNSLDVFKFLEKNGIPINVPNKDLYLPIHYACLNGSLKIFEYILSVEPDQAKALPQVEYHLIHLTILSRNAEILRLLFKNGADPNSPENKKNRPLTCAIQSHRNECIKVLLENRIINEFYYMNYSPVMLAIACNEPDYVPLLVESGIDIKHVSSETNETALSLACLQSFRSTVKYLCDRMNYVDIDESIQVKAAVHWICQSKDPEIVKTVLLKGINVNRLDLDGNPGPFYLIDATDEDTTIEILELLYECGLDLNIQGKSVYGEEANTILGDFVISIRRPIKVIEWLLQHGARPETRYKNESIIDIVQKQRNRKLKQLFNKYV